MASPLPWLADNDLTFPDIDDALTDPDGLLAVGGDLSVPRLIAAYRSGIFPWFEDGQPILWWSPDPRCVIDPSSYQPSKSLRKRMRKNDFQIRVDQDFESVISSCGQRGGQEGTWITEEMKSAYIALHRSGYAHSVECYMDGKLVGGLYGVSLGRMYFGESMFHRETDASKIAFHALMQMMKQVGCPLVDCQIPNPHLFSMGAVEITRSEFREVLERHVDVPAIDWAELAETGAIG